MDLRNWEFSTLGTAIVGADVYVYEASLTHPNANSVLSSTTTNGDGMWAFTGLTDTAKDVKVVHNGKAKWYKGMARHSVGAVFVDDTPTGDFAQLTGQSSVSAPTNGIGRLYFKTDGNLYRQYGSAGERPVSGLARIDEKSGGGASIEFTSIPQIYRALMLYVCGRSDAAGTAGASVWMTFETTPTVGAYNTQRSVMAAATSSISEQVGSVDRIDCGAVPTDGSMANLYSGIKIDMPEYANTGMLKNVITHSGSVTDVATAGISVRTNYGIWESAAAIDRVILKLSTGNWKSASRVTLWGLF